jgi:putative flippase GtrA
MFQIYNLNFTSKRKIRKVWFCPIVGIFVFKFLIYFEMIASARKARNFIIAVIDCVHKPFRNIIPQETVRYGATGGANTLLDIFLYFFCYNYVLDKNIVDLGIVAISPHIAAFLIVFPVTFSTGFLLAKYITFTQSKLRGRIQLFRYGLSVGGSFLLNYIFLKIFVEIMGIYPTPSKILTTVVVIAYSYIIQKHFTFKTGKRALARYEAKYEPENKKSRPEQDSL